MMVAAQPAKAGDYDFLDNWFTDGANWSQEASSVKIYYDSYDGQKNKVKLSATVYYMSPESIGMPSNTGGGGLALNKVKHILLNCHPTVTNNLSAPSGPDPVDKEINRMAGAKGKSFIVVCPDYCGYGITSQLQHPYLIHDVTARNCIDAVMAVLQSGKFVFDSDYVTDIVGYSQGGATALACAKYMESFACSDYVRSKIRLRHTACGDGPYSILATINQYLEWGDPSREDGGEDLAYPCVLPLIVAAAKDAYGDGCMRTVEVDDYFDEKFLATGVKRLLETKNVSTDIINDEIIKRMPRRRPVDVFSNKIIDKKTGKFNTDTNEYRCLMRAMQLAELSTGWTPTHPIVFYHFKSDKVVPYVNYLAVENGIQSQYPDLVKSVDPVACHSSIPTIIKVAKDVEDDDVKWEEIDHARGGFMFYLAYMMSYSMRPNE